MSPSPISNDTVRAWIAMLGIATVKPAWHGKNLASTLRGVDAATAHLVPPGKERTIWQITLHCAYWCYRVRMRISGQPGRRFPRRGSDWLSQPHVPDPQQWKADQVLVWEEYEKLIGFLEDVIAGRQQFALDAEDVERLVVGAALHAVHHGSQIMQFRRALER